MSFASLLRCNLLGLLAACALCAQNTPHPLMKQYNVAWQLEGERRPDEAIPLLKEIIAKDKTFYRAYRTLVQAYEQKRQLERAEEYFQELLREDPGNGLAHYGLGEVYYSQSRPGPAAENLAQCIRQSPQAFICYFRLPDTGILQKVPVPKDPDNPYRDLLLARMYQIQRKLPGSMEATRVGLERAGARHLFELQAVFHRLYAGLFSSAEERFTDSLVHDLAALQIFEEADDLEGQFSAGLSVAATYSRLGQLDQALTYARHYLETARRLRHRRWELSCLIVLGQYDSDHGEETAALEVLLQGQRLIDDFDLREPGFPLTLLIGRVYRKQGHLLPALQCFEQARMKTIRIADKGNEPIVLRSLGELYAEMGDYVKSLECEIQALHLFRMRREDWRAGVALADIAGSFAALGDYRGALYDYRQSLEIAYENHRAGDIESVLADMADLYLRIGKPHKALSCLTNSLQLSQRVKSQSIKASVLLGLGAVHQRLGQLSNALEDFGEALNIATTIGSTPLESQVLAKRGDCYLKSGNLDAAERDFKAGLEAAERMGFREVVIATHRGLADTRRKRGDYINCLAHLQTAVETIEQIRGRIPTPELRSGFLEQNSKVYEDVIDVLSVLNKRDRTRQYDRLAFHYAEKGRARSFLDTLAEAKAHVTAGLTDEQVNQQSALLSEISKASAALMRDETSAKRQALDRAERDLAEWAVQLRAINPKYQEFQYPEPYSVERVQSTIDADTALLEYVLGTERSQLWIITAGRATMLTLPGRAEIEQAVTEYRVAVPSHPRGDQGLTSYLAHCTQLYELLLRPASKYLIAARKLLIVPDGVLHYIPFETLAKRRSESSSPRYLIEDFTITYAPSASVFGNLLRGRHSSNAPQRKLLAYGDPTLGTRQPATDGPRPLSEVVRSVYRRSGMNFAPLPYTRVEVTEIAQLYAPDMRTIHLGRDASEASVKRENLTEYRHLHFATHALIDDEIPARSGVVLSLVNAGAEDGILRMSEIFNLKIDADLVVLSACQTGLGKLVKGEGIVGLTRAFMYAGTPRVAVSLWEVNDLATAEFMQRFYQHIKAGQLTADALRAAKLAMIHSDTSAYRHPYFWAPFVLVGLF